MSQMISDCNRGSYRRPNVKLEPQTADHACELFKITSQAEVHEFTDSVPPRDIDEFAARLKRLETQLSPDGNERWLNWIVRNEAGSIVGYVQASVYKDHSADIAFVIGKEYWGNGIAFEACKLMIKHIFLNYDIIRLCATVDENNKRSINLLNRLELKEHPSSIDRELRFEAKTCELSYLIR